MHTLKSVFMQLVCRGQMIVWPVLLLCFFTQPAHADIIDSFNLAPFVPLVLETMMNIAISLYKFFVGNGAGLIYICVYAFAGFYVAMYLVKMYLPKDWLSFFGFSGGGEMWEGKADGFAIADNILKPCLRAVIAAIILLPIKPTYISQALINPFLEFGSVYTKSILNNITTIDEGKIEAPACPVSIAESGWISKRSCDFLIQPVYTISKENNRIIKYGFNFLKTGFRGLVVPIPHGGEDMMNIITGILLIFAFVSSNVFMALLIIQGIFDFCLSLIMYPFNVLAWVVKKSDKWFDVLPAFSQIIEALKKLVIIMIACAFILCINIAIIHALFNWSSSIFVVAANGTAITNVPTITNSAMNFGQHSMLWISALLTFFLMQNIFNMTRERLELYTGIKTKDAWLYNKATGDAKNIWNKVKATPDTIKNIAGGVKKVIKKN